jgi:hypothetical protein
LEGGSGVNHSRQRKQTQNSRPTPPLQFSCDGGMPMQSDKRFHF